MSLEAPTTFVRNVGAHDWHEEAPDTSKPPDRFAPFPGNGNYRGGAIFSFDQMKLLKDDYGIKTIVNLSLGSMKRQPPNSPASIPCSYPDDNCEPKWAAELGLNYVYVPMTGEWRMTDAKWNRIREALIEGHAYVHCTHGVDRTGGVVARWIRELLGWDQAQVMAYTRKFGGAWRTDPDWRKTDDAEIGYWVEEATYDPTLQGQLSTDLPDLFSPKNLPVTLIGGAALFVWGAVLWQRWRSS